MFAGDAIFVLFLGNAYFWFINVSRPRFSSCWCIWNSLLNASG